jgi:hypothetical protein
MKNVQSKKKLKKIAANQGKNQNLWVHVIFCFQLDNYEIKSGKRLKVNISVANQRLFVGNIPKSKSKEEIMEEFSKKTGIKNLKNFVLMIFGIFTSSEKDD